MANIQNLASGILAESITASATTVLVNVGSGSAAVIKAVWPTAPFYVTVMPNSPVVGVANALDSEVMLVTAVGNDQVGNVSLTVTRAQKNTSAKTFSAGAVVTNGIYVEDILDKFYPVGTVFTSTAITTASDVGTQLGGTWSLDSSSGGKYVYIRTA